MQKYLGADNQQGINMLKKYYKGVKNEDTPKTGSFQFNTLNKNLAYLIGVYMSDGCIYVNKNGWSWFTLEVIDEDFAQRTQDAVNSVLQIDKLICKYQRKLQKIQMGKKVYEVNGRTYYKAYASNQDLCRWLMEITNKKQCIPDIVLSADKMLQKEFLAAIFDSDGWALKRTSGNGKYNNGNIAIGLASSRLWIFEVKILLESLGVKITSFNRETKNRKTPLWRMNINAESFVRAGLYFYIARKYQRVINWKNIHFKPSETKRMTSYKRYVRYNDKMMV